MKTYWGNWILSSTLIFVCISFLLWSPLLVPARRTRSSRHHKTKHSEYTKENVDSGLDAETTPQPGNSDINGNETSSISPASQQSEKQTYDVCQGWWCGHGRECQRGSDGLPSCIYMRECRAKPPPTTSTNVKNREGTSNDNINGYLEYGKGFEEFYEQYPDSELVFPPDAIAVRLNEFKPVCGSDGKIYPNQCELYRTACITNHPYLHADESEESCRHVVAPGGSEAGNRGRNPALPPYVSGSGRGVVGGQGPDKETGIRDGGSRGPTVPGTGGKSPRPGSRDNPFGDSPSFLGPGGADLPLFSSADDIPSFGGVDIPFSPNGDGFGQSEFPTNFGGGGNSNTGADDKVDKFGPHKPGQGSNRPGSGKHNENDKDKAKDDARRNGKLTSGIKNTDFGTAEAAAAASVTSRKWALPESTLKNRLSLEDISSEEDGEDDAELDDEDEDDEDDEDYSGELDGYSFIYESKLSLLEDSGTAAAAIQAQSHSKKVAPSTSLGSRLSGSSKQRMEGISSATNIKGNSGNGWGLKHYQNIVLGREENYNGNRMGANKGRKKKRKIMMKKTREGESQRKPSKSRWDVDVDNEDDEVLSNDDPASSIYNNLARDQKKSSRRKESDDLSWRMDSLINKNIKTASRISGGGGEDDDADDGDGDSLPSSSQNREADGNSDEIGESGKSDAKTFLPSARRGSSLCSREEYEILKDALLIYNHQHLIGDSGLRKKKKSRNGRKHPNSYRRGGRLKSDNDKDDDDEVKVNEQSVDDDDDSNVEDDSNEEDEEDDDGGAFQPEPQRSGGSRTAKRRFGYEDESTFEKEYLLSLMFAHFDQNNNGKLDYAELQKVGMEQKIAEKSTIHCHLVDFLRFDDMDHDNLISPNEFYAAFSKLYSISILGIGRPRSPIHLTARVGEMLEIKCSVGAGSVTTVPGGEHTKKRKVERNNAPSSLFSQDEDEDDDESSDNDATGNEREAELEFSNDADETNNIDEESGRAPRKASSIIQASSSPSSPPIPTTQWFLYGVDVSKLIKLGEQFQIHKDGTLLINRVELIHAGNYSCHDDRGNEKVIQPYVLAVQNKFYSFQYNETEFLVFHQKGISTYDPENCRLEHQILGMDIIPGTQRDYICGSSAPSSCERGRAIRVSNVYVYMSQPKLF